MSQPHDVADAPAQPFPLVLATRNRKKGREMLGLIAPPWEANSRLSRVVVHTLDQYPEAPEVVEDADTFSGNARKKAAETARALGQWVLADDSGLSVDAIGGEPGVYSARYAGEHGNDEANNLKLLEALAEVPDALRGGSFICCLALADPSGEIQLEAEGACRGLISRASQGEGGFGYDPLFIIPEYHRSFGELSPLVKQQLSHRARAFGRLRPGLERIIATHNPAA